MSSDDDDPGATRDHLLDAGVEQFQRAALDAVNAARAVLDAAEAMLREPAAIEAVVNTMSAVARTATESVAGFAAEAARRAEQATGASPSAAPGDGGERDDPGGFERISVD